MRIGLFPFVIAAAAAALALLGAGVFLLLRGRKPLGWVPILLVLVALAVVDGIVCLALIISAGLSHSAAAHEAAPMKCLAATAVLVVLPAIVLVIVRQIRARGPGNPAPPQA